MATQWRIAVGVLFLAVSASASLAQDREDGRNDKWVDVRLTPAVEASLQYEPVYVRWSISNTHGDAVRFAPLRTLDVERWDGAGWVSPYSRPNSPQPREAASDERQPLPKSTTMNGTLEFVDLAVVGVPGRYRARAWTEVCEFELPARTDEAPWPSYRRLGSANSNWVEFEVAHHERNEAFFQRASESSPADFHRCQEILYATDYDTALFTQGVPPQLDSVLRTHEAAQRILESGCSSGLVRKANMWLAFDQIARGAYLSGTGADAAARSSYQAARKYLVEARVPAGSPAESSVAPVTAALEVHCLRKLGDNSAADALLAQLKRDFPDYLAKRPQAAQVLERP